MKGTESCKMKKSFKAPLALLLIGIILITSLSACGKTSNNASRDAAEPTGLDQSDYEAFMETYAPPGVVTDVKSAIVGEWYYTGYCTDSVPRYSLSYEPSIIFSADGTIRIRNSQNEYYQCEYKIDDLNTLFIDGQSLSFSSEARNDTYYLENYDGIQLTLEGLKYVKEFPKGELFKKIIGTWERESEYGSYFDKITFYEDCSAVWVSYDKKEEEQHGSFAINEKEKLLYINGCAKPFFIWDLSQTSITYEYGEDMWDAGKISYYTWGFSDFGDSYNLIISGCSYKKIAD